jgi:hypothetical protein
MDGSAAEGRPVSQLRQEQVLSMPELRQRCGTSHMSIFRALRRHGYLTSYNHNGAFYTLAETPVFDERGLWAWRDVRFSRFGTLAATLVQWVDRSPAGCRAEELERDLGVRAQNHLRLLARQDRLRREKLGASYVYFSAVEARCKEQQRQARPPAAAEPFRLPPGIRHVTLIRLLVAKLANPEAEPAVLARRLRAEGETLDASTVRAVLAFYGLDGKKNS